MLHAGPQVWVYEEADEETEDNLYVHHDVIVPYFPLSVAWLDLDPSGASDFRLHRFAVLALIGRQRAVKM
jgi:hypothetical protein